LMVPLLAVALAGAPLLGVVPPVVAALVAVAAAAALAALAMGAARVDAVIAGAGAALVHAALVPVSPVLAGGAAMAAIFVPRALRARGAIAAAAKVVIAGVGGGIAAAVIDAHFLGGATLAIQGTAVGVATLVAIAPLALGVDDAVAYTLRRAARSTAGATRTRLLRALVLRRRDAIVMSGVSRSARRRIEDAWREVARTAALRADAPGPELAVLDRRLDLYLAALRRAQRAAATARALDSALDARVLAALELERTDLEARAEALGGLEPAEPDVDLTPVAPPVEPAPEPNGGFTA
jgi:hypothetical protein